MTRVRLLGKRGGRCAYCKDSLDATAVRCDGCGTQAHQDCLEELGRCPTLGCEAHPGGVAGGRAGAGGGRRERRGRRERHRQHLRDHGQEVMERLAERRQRPARRSARDAIHSRLSTSRLVHSVVVVALVVLLVFCLTHHEAVWTMLKHGKRGRLLSDGVAYFKGLLFGGLATGVGAYCVWWIRRVPSVREDVERLLDESTPVPMHLAVVTRGSGKNARNYAILRNGYTTLEYQIGGLSIPGWMRPGFTPGDVLVYGSDDPTTPVVVEFLDGRLVLLKD